MNELNNLGQCKYCRPILRAQIWVPEDSEADPIFYCKCCGKFLFRNLTYTIPSDILMKKRTCEECLSRQLNISLNKLEAQMDTHADVKDLGMTVEKQQVTKFADDVDVQSFEKPLASVVSQWIRTAKDSDEHTVISVLKRPIRVFDGVFDTSTEGSTPSLALRFPDILLQTNTNLVKKLDYFTFFRANVKVKLVFNATPFQSGKYWLFFAPYDVASNRGVRQYAANYTGYPGVEVDIASSSAVELKIPYCAPLSHYNLVDGHSNMGHLYLKPLSKIVEGTSPTTAPFTIFAWFEDIELTMPTSQPVLVPTLLAQVGDEQHQRSERPVSGALSTIGGIAGYVADNVPILASIARPVSWVARALSSVASVFGWNKTTSLSDVVDINNSPGKGFTHMDGIDHSLVLAAAPDCGLTVPSGLFSTDADEMDIKYVCKKSCMFDLAPWNKNDARDKILTYWPVNPGVTNYGNPTIQEIGATTLGYVNSMHKYWRGGIHYRIAVAKTAFHSGRLRITFHPAVFTLGANTVYENAYNWILDLSVSSELDFVVPYCSNMPWKQTYLGTPDAIRTFGENGSTGLITVTVLNPLKVANAAASDQIELCSWISADDDIAFAVPSFDDYFPSDFGMTTLLNEPLQAQVLNETAKGIEHNEQMVSTSDKLFDMSRMQATVAEQLCIGEKISNLRQLIKRFGIAGSCEPYPNRRVNGGVVSPDNFAYVGGQQSYPDGQGWRIQLDPAYFGSMQEEPYENPQDYPLIVGLDAAGNATTSPCRIGSNTSRITPLQYVSYLYRFYTGGRRYKFMMGSNDVATTSSFALCGVPTGPLEALGAATSVLPQTQLKKQRDDVPLRVWRDNVFSVNGTILPPNMLAQMPSGTDIAVTSMRHIVYPDLNGVCEFEVPYYSQTPISLVAEDGVSLNEGLTNVRATVWVSRGFSDRDYVVPTTVVSAVTPYPDAVGAFASTFGAATILEAAADDFSFGYLVGVPSLHRLV